jgi:SnoaL-like domain
MEDWELLAREQIRDVVTRYNSYGDAGRLSEMIRVFTPDARMEAIEGDETLIYDGRDQILQLLEGVKTRWAHAATNRGEAAYVRHFVSTHQIDMVSPTAATGRCYVAVIMAHGLDHWGRYLDRYVCHDGQWLIAHRRAITDGRRPEMARDQSHVHDAG